MFEMKMEMFDLPEFIYFKLCTRSNTHAAVEVSRNNILKHQLFLLKYHLSQDFLN